MRKISKGLAIAAAALVIGGAGVAIAQTGAPGFGPGYGMMGYGPGGGYGGYGGYGMMGGAGGGWGPMGVMHGPGGYGWMRGAARGFVDPTAMLGALKNELGIRPEQETAWDAYANAVQDSAKQMQALRGNIDADQLRSMDWQQHQAFMANLVNQRAAAFKAVQDAGSKLMAALDDSQKARLLPAGLGSGGPGRFGGFGGGPCPGFGYGMMGGGPGGGR